MLKLYVAQEASELQSFVGRFLAKSLKTVKDDGDSLMRYTVHFLIEFVKMSGKKMTWTF